MKTKKILNTCAGLITLGGASAGGYYALNSNKNVEVTLPEKTDIPKENRPKNIKQILASGGLSPLDTATEKDDDTWKNLIKTFIDGGLSESQKISAVIARTSDPTRDNSANMENIKRECNRLFEQTEDKDSEFAKNKKLAEDWCIKESDLLKSAGAASRHT